LVKQRSRYPITSRTLMMMSALIGLSSHVRAESFFGASRPAVYLRSMLNSVESWDVQQRDFFRMRAIEASYWPPGQTVMLLDSDYMIAQLARHFKIFKGQSIEIGSFSALTLKMAEAHPDLTALAAKTRFAKGLFHGHASPAEFFFSTVQEGGAYSPQELMKLKRLLSEGSTWEKKYPKIDFQIPTNAAFIERIKLSIPSLRIKSTWRGYRVRDIYSSVASTNKKAVLK
jgi:hypothetical protein